MKPKKAGDTVEPNAGGLGRVFAADHDAGRPSAVGRTFRHHPRRYANIHDRIVQDPRTWGGEPVIRGHLGAGAHHPGGGSPRAIGRRIFSGDFPDPDRGRRAGRIGSAASAEEDRAFVPLPRAPRGFGSMRISPGGIGEDFGRRGPRRRYLPGRRV